MSSCRVAAIVVLACLTAAGASAQAVPAEPVSVGGGHLTVGGDVAFAVAPIDDGFFNYGSYEHNSLRELRMGFAAQFRANSRLSLLAQVRSENFDDITPFALYARIRPFVNKRLDVQVGRIPPTFGRASRTPYARDNPLIGQPLAYQYLTSLRPDALPASADELLGMRGRGWLSSYSIGDPEPAAGVPLAAAFTWDTGVQVTGGLGPVTATGAVTVGTLSNPRVRDDNAGKQFVTRVTYAAAPGLELGTSFARGQFVSRSALRALDQTSGGAYVQQAYGLDAEFARGHWIARAEGVMSEWRIPLAGEIEPLRALAGSLETRYALLPGIYAAARVDHLAFSRIQGSMVTMAWDAPVTRVEIGGGYYVRRNVVARLSWQTNERAGGRIRTGRFVAAQLLVWF